MAKIDLHARNVKGLGAINYVTGLIKELNEQKNITFKTAFLNSKNQFKNIIKYDDLNVCEYKFGKISRFLEVVLWKHFQKSENSILVLGDLPLNTNAKQYVLCHQALIFQPFRIFRLSSLKFLILRFIFINNLKKNDVVLVQTESMKNKVSKIINPNIKICIVNFPYNAFEWLNFRRFNRQTTSKYIRDKIQLIYPAAPYPHKNHKFLKSTNFGKHFEIVFTCKPEDLNLTLQQIEYAGQLTQKQLYEHFKHVDGIIFLSECESLGLPLLEALKCNLPIICPVADYTKNLESDNCFFFNLDEPESLSLALINLQTKIEKGWWPDWDFKNFITEKDASPMFEILLKE